MKWSPSHLTAFLRLAETQSFTLAADLLGVSQPTLSRTIQQAEQIAGAKLFDRDTRKIVLTSVGAELCPIARRLLHEFDSAEVEFAQVVKGQRGRLTIAALPSIAAVLLPRAIARFRAVHPDIDVLIQDSLSESVLTRVADGQADAGITIRPPSIGRLSYKPLISDRFCLVSRIGDAAASSAPAEWAIFETQPFVAMSPASSVRAMTDAAFLQAGLSVAPLYECAHLGTTGGLVEAGLGLTALPELAFALLANKGLTTTPLQRPLLTRSIGVVMRAGRPARIALQAMLDALAAEAAALQPRV